MQNYDLWFNGGRDRCRLAQWYNFWFAGALVVSLTLIFGLVQSIEGGLPGVHSVSSIILMTVASMGLMLRPTLNMCFSLVTQSGALD